jgi:hypothetical protein
MDAVHHPSHYTSGGIECIDALRASMSENEFQGYLKGNIIKYLWRYEHKGKPLEDIQKAAWYLARLENEVKNGLARRSNYVATETEHQGSRRDYHKEVFSERETQESV